MESTGKLHHINAWERKAVPSTASGTSLVTPTGYNGLDELLPCGGWPKSGLVEINAPDEYTDVVALLMPALVRLSHQGRWLAMVTPPCQARTRLFTDAELNPARVLQVNPHPGRSALWTAESMLHSGSCGAVLVWPNCNTELMGRRLQKAAVRGKALGILISTGNMSSSTSSIDIRLKLEVDATGSVVYLVNNRGEILSGTALA